MHSFFKVITVFFVLSSLVVADNDSQVVRVEIATILWDDTSTDEKFPFKKTYSLIEEAVKLNKDEDFSQETDFFTVLPRSYHKLSDALDVDKINEAEFVEHVSWMQKLTTFDDSKYVLVSENQSQCVVRVFQLRHPRVNTKCSRGPKSLEDTEFIIFSDGVFKKLESKNSSLSKRADVVREHFLLEEEKRVKLNEFYYFDHPKIGIIIGIFSI